MAFQGKWHGIEGTAYFTFPNSDSYVEYKGVQFLEKELLHSIEETIKECGFAKTGMTAQKYLDNPKGKEGIIKLLDIKISQRNEREGNKMNNDELVFKDIIETIEFSISKEHDGYALHDSTGANLGNIESERFCSAVDILDRIDHYLNDYFFTDLEDEAESIIQSENTEMPCSAEDWVKFMDEHEDFKNEHSLDYKVMEFLAQPNIDIDMENVIDESNIDIIINAETPFYTVSSYYDDKFVGLEAENDSYDWSKVEEMAHEKLMKGFNVEIYGSEQHNTIKIKADDYIRDWEEHDLAEFPYKPDDLNKKTTKAVNYEKE